MPGSDASRWQARGHQLVLGKLSDPGFGALMDVNMLAASPGQERSLDESGRTARRGRLAAHGRFYCWLPAKRERSRRRLSRPCPGLIRSRRQTRMTELDDQVVAEFRANAGVVPHAMGGHFGVESVQVDDSAIISAREQLWNEYRIAAEHGAAAAYAALSSGVYTPSRDERVAVLISGANTAPATLATGGS